MVTNMWLATLLLSTVLCNPCSRTWYNTTLSDTPVILCATVTKTNYWMTGALGVVLLGRPSGTTQWIELRTIPHVEVVDDRGLLTLYITGLLFTGEQHQDDTRRYITTTLPYHRYTNITPGELWDFSVVPYNAMGYLNPIEVECQGCGCNQCTPCGYVRLCVYPVQTIFPQQQGMPSCG